MKATEERVNEQSETRARSTEQIPLTDLNGSHTDGTDTDSSADGEKADSSDEDYDEEKAFGSFGDGKMIARAVSAGVQVELRAATAARVAAAARLAAAAAGERSRLMVSGPRRSCSAGSNSSYGSSVDEIKV